MLKTIYDQRLIFQTIRAQGLLAIVLLLSVANSMLIYKLVTTENNEKTIIEPMVTTKTYWVEGNQSSPEYIEQMGLTVINLLNNISPLSIDYQIERVLAITSPKYYGALKVQLNKDAARIKLRDMSTTFHPIEVRLKGNDVAFIGDLRTIVGATQTNKRYTAFRVNFSFDGGRIGITGYSEVDATSPFATIANEQEGN